MQQPLRPPIPDEPFDVADWTDRVTRAANTIDQMPTRIPMRRSDSPAGRVLSLGLRPTLPVRLGAHAGGGSYPFTQTSDAPGNPTLPGGLAGTAYHLNRQANLGGKAVEAFQGDGGHWWFTNPRGGSGSGSGTGSYFVSVPIILPCPAGSLGGPGAATSCTAVLAGNGQPNQAVSGLISTQANDGGTPILFFPATVPAGTYTITVSGDQRQTTTCTFTIQPGEASRGQAGQILYKGCQVYLPAVAGFVCPCCDGRLIPIGPYHFTCKYGTYPIDLTGGHGSLTVVASEPQSLMPENCVNGDGSTSSIVHLKPAANNVTVVYDVTCTFSPATKTTSYTVRKQFRYTAASDCVVQNGVVTGTTTGPAGQAPEFHVFDGTPSSPWLVDVAASGTCVPLNLTASIAVQRYEWRSPDYSTNPPTHFYADILGSADTITVTQ